MPYLLEIYQSIIAEHLVRDVHEIHRFFARFYKNLEKEHFFHFMHLFGYKTVSLINDRRIRYLCLENHAQVFT